MSLTIFEPPADSVSFLRRFIASVTAAADRAAPARALEGLASQDLRMAAPHPVFNLEASTVVPGGDFESCRMTAWNYLVLAGPRVVATAGFAAGHWNEQALRAQVGGSRMAVAFAQAIGQAERSPRIRGGTFVIASIRLPSLQAAALWLRDVTGNGDQDWFVPIVRTSARFAAGEMLDRARWMRQLVHAKQRVLSRPGPGE